MHCHLFAIQSMIKVEVLWSSHGTKTTRERHNNHYVSPWNRLSLNFTNNTKWTKTDIKWWREDDAKRRHHRDTIFDRDWDGLIEKVLQGPPLRIYGQKSSLRRYGFTRSPSMEKVPTMAAPRWLRYPCASSVLVPEHGALLGKPSDHSWYFGPPTIL
jgi:hypothetical protein